MFIATPRAESQAPLGAACRPTTPSREPSMPLLTELVNHLLGQPGYRHVAPTGAVPPTQECEKCRLEPSPFQLPRDRSSRRKRFRSAKPRTPQLQPAPAHPLCRFTRSQPTGTYFEILLCGLSFARSPAPHCWPSRVALRRDLLMTRQRRRALRPALQSPNPLFLHRSAPRARNCPARGRMARCSSPIIGR
jgi:hypothetical protein